jgi:curli biogenesis system outer membrane secretion channel CsgG
MKRVIAISLLILIITGCASFRSKLPIFQKDKTTGITTLPPYIGPRAKIVVADFEVKASKATDEIGRGLREMLVAALKSNNHFLITEPQELNSNLATENLSAQNVVQADALCITVVVTEFEPRASGGSAGIGGGGGVNRGILGGLLTTTTLSKPHIALDIRIVDTSTLKALASTRALGQALDVEKAIRICMIEAERFISQNIPVDYYK